MWDKACGKEREFIIPVQMEEARSSCKKEKQRLKQSCIVVTAKEVTVGILSEILVEIVDIFTDLAEILRKTITRWS